MAKPKVIDSEQLRPALETIVKVYASRNDTSLTPERKAKLLVPGTVQKLQAILAKGLYANLADEDTCNKVLDEILSALDD